MSRRGHSRQKFSKRQFQYLILLIDKVAVHGRVINQVMKSNDMSLSDKQYQKK